MNYTAGLNLIHIIGCEKGCHHGPAGKEGI